MTERRTRGSPNRESWCKSQAHSSENRGFSTVAGLMSGGRSFVHVGASFSAYGLSTSLCSQERSVFSYGCGTDWRICLVSHGRQRCLFSEVEYHDLVKSSHVSTHVARWVSRSSLHERIRMMGSLLFRFGTLLRLRIRMDPLSTLGSPLSGPYGSCMDTCRSPLVRTFQSLSRPLGCLSTPFPRTILPILPTSFGPRV